MEALELVSTVGRQPHGVALVGKLPASVQHLAAQGLGGRAVEAVQLPPQDVAHLPEGGRGAKGDGGVLVGVHEPQHRDGGAEALAQPIACLYRHAAMLGEGVQHLDLLGPQLHAQHLAGEGHWRGQRRAGCPLILSLSKDRRTAAGSVSRLSRHRLPPQPGSVAPAYLLGLPGLDVRAAGEGRGLNRYPQSRQR